MGLVDSALLGGRLRALLPPKLTALSYAGAVPAGSLPLGLEIAIPTAAEQAV